MTQPRGAVTTARVARDVVRSARPYGVPQIGAYEEWTQTVTQHQARGGVAAALRGTALITASVAATVPATVAGRQVVRELKPVDAEPTLSPREMFTSDLLTRAAVVPAAFGALSHRHKLRGAVLGLGVATVATVAEHGWLALFGDPYAREERRRVTRC